MELLKIFTICIWVIYPLYIVLEAYVHAHMHKRKIYLYERDYKFVWLERCGVAFATLLAFGIVTDMSLSVDWSVNNVIYITSLFIGASIPLQYWIIFDSARSLFLGLNWDYIPKKNPNSAKTDSIFAGKRNLWLASKILALVLHIGLIVWWVFYINGSLII